ncbi:hypothetical protein V8C35DRAFT_134371 [Trichoderma chlorosporum]
MPRLRCQADEDFSDEEEISGSVPRQALGSTIVTFFGIPANGICTRPYHFAVDFPSRPRFRCRLVGSRPFGRLTADEAERAVRWLLSLGLAEQGQDLYMRWAQTEARCSFRNQRTASLH